MGLVDHTFHVLFDQTGGGISWISEIDGENE